MAHGVAVLASTLEGSTLSLPRLSLPLSLSPSLHLSIRCVPLSLLPAVSESQSEKEIALWLVALLPLKFSHTGN